VSIRASAGTSATFPSIELHAIRSAPRVYSAVELCHACFHELWVTHPQFKAPRRLRNDPLQEAREHGPGPIDKAAPFRSDAPPAACILPANRAVSWSESRRLAGTRPVSIRILGRAKRDRRLVKDPSASTAGLLSEPTHSGRFAG